MAFGTKKSVVVAPSFSEREAETFMSNIEKLI